MAQHIVWKAFLRLLCREGTKGPRGLPKLWVYDAQAARVPGEESTTQRSPSLQRLPLKSAHADTQARALAQPVGRTRRRSRWKGSPLTQSQTWFVFPMANVENMRN